LAAVFGVPQRETFTVWNAPDIVIQPIGDISRNYSRRQASGFSFEAILRTRSQVLQIRQFHVVDGLPKPQTWSDIAMKQAFSSSTPTHRE
jgi:hypothetical protein